jgi:hypothetical protein
MIAASDPNLIVGGFAIGGLGLAALWKLIAWVRDAPVKPDPWDDEVEQQLLEAAEACPRCSTPQPPNAWFCAHCGKAVGTYNNWMPYVDIFSQGEVLRNGVTDKLHTGPLTIIGYLIYSLGNYFIFAPIYWFFFFKNLKRLNELPAGEDVK